MMKRVICAFLVIFAVLLTACDRRGGYEDGYSDGYSHALKDATSMVEDRLKDEMRHLSKSIDNEYGMDPEDAVKILMVVADGESVSERELIHAMWAVWEYYWGSEEIIDDIGSYLFD